MSSLKKAKKVIMINYCFENGDELEIPFTYKPAVMNHIKLTFDDYLLSTMRNKGNREYYAALLDSVIIYVKYSGEVTKDFLLNTISDKEYNALVGLGEIIIDLEQPFLIIPMGEQLIHDACAKSLQGQINKKSIKSAYRYKQSFPRQFELNETVNTTPAKLKANYRSTHSIRALKGA